MLSLEQIEVLEDVFVERAEEILCPMNSQGTIDRFLSQRQRRLQQHYYSHRRREWIFAGHRAWN